MHIRTMPYIGIYPPPPRPTHTHHETVCLPVFSICIILYGIESVPVFSVVFFSPDFAI